MEFVKKNWKIILIVLLILFGMNKCTVSCNRGTKIDKQQIELVQKDSIIKAQADSLNIFKVRWDENQKGQVNYQNLAKGTKQDLENEIESLNNVINAYKNQVNALKNQNAKLIKENNQLKGQLNGK
jgi:peptidoglycan hydrolase CwlO-like protein